MDTIQETIYDMLTENTGKHFLDSGGSSNRHWQRNQEKTIDDFINEEEQVYQIGFDQNGKADEILRTVSVFHYLAGSGSNLELDSICKKFNALNKIDDELADCEPYGVGVMAWDYLNKYIDGTHIRIFNTCNYDCDLSQTLQGASLRLFVDGQYEDYILIQIHGGCDVRGGYTNAMLFKCEDVIINEYLFDSMDWGDMEQELEYIESAVDYDDNKKVYEGKELEKIKSQLMEVI
tara:strand:+ start:78 stop:779 length:702 start_codon:yes stop_codon:yes gene_type:complete